MGNDVSIIGDIFRFGYDMIFGAARQQPRLICGPVLPTVIFGITLVSDFVRKSSANCDTWKILT